MTKILRTAILSATLALAGAVTADATPTVPEGGYGCCCPWAEAVGLCPVDLVVFMGATDDVCFLLDDAGDLVGFCLDDPEGAYPFRGLSWPEIAELLAATYGFEPTVGGAIDFFCGLGRTAAPAAP